MEKILILDFGSQFTQLIARRVRELGVYCEIVGHRYSESQIQNFAPNGIILSGGPQSVMSSEAWEVNAAIFLQNVPVLGICYGMQVMMQHFGGTIESGTHRREYGYAMVTPQPTACPLWFGLEDKPIEAWMSHGDHVLEAAKNFQVIARSDNNLIAAVADRQRQFYGLQFHPEVGHTKQGMQILENFLHQICGLQRQWTMPNFIEQAVSRIEEEVGTDGVLLALSGGVDSAVVAALLHRALGSQLVCVLVDNGLLRHREVETIQTLVEKQFKIKFIVVDAREKFITALRGIIDPEEKRRRIGHLFIDVFEAEARALGAHVRWLAQGTIYPDVVESAKTGVGKATIKSHHNVGGLPERLELKLLEPIRDLFKDEVRVLGRDLGIDNCFINRHPFPGPGLAVRVLGEVTAERLEVTRQADAIFLEELNNSGAYHQTAQAFTVLLPVNTVGVMGDERSYENVIALRAVTTDDFMTADWARLDNTLLARVSNRIINEVKGVNRVVYDISSKPPATIEWE